ncbi:DUF3833 domain-containing protein [Pseudoduganella aquatica]|uniref:DUF3833 family protein n=1 Tax=Pseudoduganella aquatica TaxID=2660641 RepID=A0A7X4H921_9BURK|nr:DUF3833 domain-containing protein [Pseudoduganella aquatica]MYN06187.1 DUF3833 family protein [Pseudoduganella aquatica]
MKIKLLRACFAGAAMSAMMASLLSGCSTRADPSHYAAQTPVLDVQRYFNGRVLAYGMFQDRGGTVQKRFTVTMTCTWRDGIGTLDEEFLYADGTRQRRVWTLRQTAPGRYTGTAADVVGEATGVVAGNALRWNYVLALPVDGKTINVDFEDWMFMIDEEVMLNRAAMSKFGIDLGSVTLSFRKQKDGNGAQ